MYLWIAIFTAQPHKEERFLFVIYPLIVFNAAVSIFSIRRIITIFTQFVHYVIMHSFKLLFLIIYIFINIMCKSWNFINYLFICLFVYFIIIYLYYIIYKYKIKLIYI